MLWPKYSGDTPDKLQLECLTSDRMSMKTEAIPTSSLCQFKKSDPQAKPPGNVPRSEDQNALPWSPSEQQVAPYHGTTRCNKLRYNKKWWLYNSYVGFFGRLVLSGGRHAIAGGLLAALCNGESRRVVFWLELAAAGHQHCFNASQTTSSPCKKGLE